MEIFSVNQAGQVRTETWQGRQWFVAPVTMTLPDSVMAGSDGPIFYPWSETKKAAKAWNGMPILVYHPKGPKGENLRARDDAGVRQRQQVGLLRNVHTNGKLGGEAWYDQERTRKIDPRVYDALKNNRKIEVSTGLDLTKIPAPSDSMDSQGRYYTHIATNHIPDHLATLPDQQGACSIRDGCGVLNQQQIEAAEDWMREGFTINLDKQGGEEPAVSNKALETADFVTLPKGVEGTNCENCRFESGGKCQHEGIKGQPVNARNCCAYWDSKGTLRAWKDKAMTENAWSDEAREASAKARASSVKAHSMTEEISGKDLRGKSKNAMQASQDQLHDTAAKGHEAVAKEHKDIADKLMKSNDPKDLLEGHGHSSAASAHENAAGYNKLAHSLTKGWQDTRNSTVNEESMWLRLGRKLGILNAKNPAKTGLDATRDTKVSRPTGEVEGYDKHTPELDELDDLLGEGADDGRDKVTLKRQAANASKGGATKKQMEPDDKVVEPDSKDADSNGIGGDDTVDNDMEMEVEGGGSGGGNALATTNAWSDEARKASSDARKASNKPAEDFSASEHREAASLHEKAAEIHRGEGNLNKAADHAGMADTHRWMASNLDQGLTYTGENKGAEAVAKKASEASNKANDSGKASDHMKAYQAHMDAAQAHNLGTSKHLHEVSAEWHKGRADAIQKGKGPVGNLKNSSVTNGDPNVGDTMTWTKEERTKVVAALTVNCQCEDDKKAIANMSESTLRTLLKAHVANAKAEGSNADATGSGTKQVGDAGTEEEYPENKKKLVNPTTGNSLENWLKRDDVPDEVKDMVRNAREVDAQARASCIKRLVANAPNDAIRNAAIASYSKWNLRQLREAVAVMPTVNEGSDIAVESQDPVYNYLGASAPIDNIKTAGSEQIENARAAILEFPTLDYAEISASNDSRTNEVRNKALRQQQQQDVG